MQYSSRRERELREVPVIICGAGPVGLTSSIQLSRLGVETLLVERRDSVSTLPRARGIMSRTVEIWSHYGLYKEMTDFSLPADWCHEFTYTDALAGDIIGTMPSNCMAPGAQAENTAYEFRCAAQDQIDAMLLRCARSYSSGEIHFSTELVSHSQDEEGVTVRLRLSDGSTEEVRAQYLIAADGGHSPIREALGVGSTGPTSLGCYVNNHFTADLSRWTADRQATLIWTFGQGKVGVFQPLDGKKRWMTQIMFDPAADPPESWTDEKVLRRLRDMIGDEAAEDVQFDLHSSYTYVVGATIADRLRDGRVFLVGDAAHRIPPAGGFGMNTGIQTAHNLAWKLALVLVGAATDGLLDTFDTERREAAQRACAYGVTNLGYMRAIGMAETREEQVAAIAASRQFGNWAGLDLGVHYEGPGAYVPDNSPQPEPGHPVVDYLPSAKPGYRAPHLWLHSGAARLSSIDLFETEFVLLTGAEGSAWLAAARDPKVPVRVRAYDVHDTGRLVPERDFCKLYEIEPSGAVLVRPDGHVAWRSVNAPPDPADSLRSAVTSVIRPPLLEHPVSLYPQPE
jgi:putative polyketide hydroxylase